ncbi:MAG: phosphoribosylglycinamide formyltransferase [Bacteroidetes bacterium]|nr:phosphoribosylglycinamide formyltransferase [Bacteroidota bacterium]MBK8145080.1 phosphoribosylglycinamide formyltransferase [Bacteroidota bacterium]MBP6314534.1 phosphoribosylglycinamide formyltransferase [Chitinophagaceae bacterium]
MKKVLLFASGGGSNVKAILQYFENNKRVSFPIIICNKANAGVIDIAKQYSIDVLLLDKERFQSEILVDTLEYFKPDLLVLAGFLWKIPDFLIRAFPNKIVNIHPSLLPKFGGKGMYGHFVHEAVVANRESESGISIHLVNEQYDEGTILLQKTVAISSNDSADMVASKVLRLEHEWYAKVIESLLF